MPGVLAPLDARVIRAASCNHDRSAIILRRRWNRRSLSSEDHVANLLCISLIIKGLHLTCRQLIFRASLSNYSPSPCNRLSLPRTTTGVPPASRSSGSHSLTISTGLPQFTCWTQTFWLGCRSQSLSLRSASRCNPLGLAAHSPRDPAHRHTFTIEHSGGWSLTCVPPRIAHHLLSRVGGGDISAHRHGLTGSCSSTFQYSA